MSKNKIIIYLDGQYLQVGKDVLDQMTPGQIKRFGVFETIRTVNGKPEMIKEHLDRLYKGLHVLGISAPVSPAQLKRIAAQIMRRNPPSVLGRLRVMVYKDKSGVHAAVLVLPYVPPTDQQYRQGLRVKIIKTARRVSRTQANVKSLDYALFFRSLEKARALGYDDAILINAQGHVFESARANIFLFLNGQWVTPDLKCGCLNGIIRAQFIRMARIKKFKVAEMNVTSAMLSKAQAVYLTNSLMGIIPVTSIH